MHVSYMHRCSGEMCITDLHGKFSAQVSNVCWKLEGKLSLVRRAVVLQSCDAVGWV